MKTLKVGIASYKAMKERTLRIARGEERVRPDDPKVWFTSARSFAQVLSSENRELLRTIAETTPASLVELAKETGRAKSNLSRTLKKMSELGIVEMVPDGRRRRPRVLYDRILLDLPLTA